VILPPRYQGVLVQFFFEEVVGWFRPVVEIVQGHEDEEEEDTRQSSEEDPGVVTTKEKDFEVEQSDCLGYCVLIAVLLSRCGCAVMITKRQGHVIRGTWRRGVTIKTLFMGLSAEPTRHEETKGGKKRRDKRIGAILFTSFIFSGSSKHKLFNLLLTNNTS